MTPTLDFYNYKGTVTDVYDGDTCTISLDLGLDFELKNQKLRLYGINAPEMRGPFRDAGIASRDFLADLVFNKKVWITTHRNRKEKYGRYLAEIWLPDSNRSVNQQMVEAGHAVKYEC
jgi:micrococcal nuclease